MIIEQPYYNARGEKIGYLMKLCEENGEWSGRFMPISVYNELISQKSSESIAELTSLTSEPAAPLKHRGRPRVSRV